MPIPTTGRATRPDARRRRALLHPVLVGALAFAALLAATAFLTRPPPRVPRLTVTNPTDYDLGLEIELPGRGWLPAGTITRGTSRDLTDIVDPGPTWTIRWSTQTRAIGSESVDAGDLAARGWRIEVAPEVGTRLAEQGVPPTPPRPTSLAL